MDSVAVRHISEGAAPCPYCLASCPNYLAPCPIYIAPYPNWKPNFVYILLYSNFCFCAFRQLMNWTMLADLYPCFHRFPTTLCSDLVSFACWIAPEFWAFARESDLVVHALHCVQFVVVCALNCARIYFAPCPFPNLAGILMVRHVSCTVSLLT